MSETKDDGVAFPRLSHLTAHDAQHASHTVRFAAESAEGMPLRDYFAGQALASFAGNEAAGLYFNRDKAVVAKNCYALADAMLKAREG